MAADITQVKALELAETQLMEQDDERQQSPTPVDSTGWAADAVSLASPVNAVPMPTQTHGKIIDQTINFG
jgi:hypothetical protein